MEDVREIIAETFRVKPEDISVETTIDDIDTWDSLTHIELVVSLENRLGLEFTGDDIAEMTNIAAIERLVRAKR